MIKHILKIIWHQRRNNGWIFVELLLVFAVLCIMMDSLLVNLYTYYKPLGFDITNVYKVNIGKMSPEIPGYVPDSLLTTTDGEDLVRLVDNIRRAPQVDEICLAMNSCPYTWSNSWSQLVRADADTSVKANYYQMFNVTVSYFDVLRISDREGRPIRSIVEESTGDIVISGDMETDFFQGRSGKGKQVKWGSKSTTSETVAAVTSPIRQNEYVKSKPCFYYLMRTDEDIAKSASDAKPQNMDCLVRMRNGFRMEDMDSFLEKMGERLSVNNLYVSSVIPLEEQRPVILKSSIDNLKKKIALVGFMLVNVFFGIVGTFWLRTQYRRGEMFGSWCFPWHIEMFFERGRSFLADLYDSGGFGVYIQYALFRFAGHRPIGLHLVAFSCHFRKQLSVAGRYDLARYLVPGTQDCKDESGGGFAL